MSDTHEEQLLSDLLTRLAREDAGLDAAHLEARVIVACDAGASVRVKERVRLKDLVRLKADTTYLAVAAVVTAAMVPGIAWMMRDVQTPTAHRNEAAVVAPTNVTKPTNLTDLANPTNAAKPVRTRRVSRPSAPWRGKPTLPSSAEEFVPLMPMTEQELAGPFQLVRVQMPRASLGALRSPLDHPNELVEADVLLGEDGMARAIRVSTGASGYPWRSR